MRYLSEIFWTLSWSVCILHPNNSEFLIWPSFCQLAYFLTEIMSIQGYLQLWIKYISEFFGYIPRIFLDYFQIIPNFLYVCQSSSWLTSLLKLGSYRDISSSVGDISLKFFGGFPGMFVYQIQIILNFLYVCQSVSWLTFLLKFG